MLRLIRIELVIHWHREDPLLSLRGSFAAVAIPTPHVVFARNANDEAIWIGASM